MSSEVISIGDYIVRRLEQLDVKSMFGVPGSFLAQFLDCVDRSSITWVGGCNELNSAYSADGYARFRRSIAVLATTVGVGELSAINGIAGSFAEELPVLHIVGQQDTGSQEKHLNVIHTLGDGKYDAFAKSAIPYTCAQLLLTKLDIQLGVAADKIDQIIVDCLSKSRPAYIALPWDLVDDPKWYITTKNLEKKLERKEVEVSLDAERSAIDHIHRRFDEAFRGELEDNVVVIADVSISRHDCIKEVEDFLSVTKLPVYGTPLGKTVVNETSERYGGVYIGELSSDEVKKKVHAAKLVLFIGPLTTDFNSGKFTAELPQERSIKLHWDHTEVGFADYARTGMKVLLPKLANSLKEFSDKASQLEVPKFETVPVADKPDDPINHKWFWPRVGGWFQEKDLIVTEAGSVSYGVLDLALPKDSALLAQKLWASIGWSMGSTHGATLARGESEPNNTSATQTILFIGDGSFQMTVQELSGMVRSDIKPIIFVVKNGGYTIERLQHSPDAEYHNIVNWDYKKLLEVLSNHPENPPIQTQSYEVKTQKDLVNLLETDKIRDKKFIQLVEVVVARDDAPPALLRSLEYKPPAPGGDKGTEPEKHASRKKANWTNRVGIIGW